jgi:hypothetical protein
MAEIIGVLVGLAFGAAVWWGSIFIVGLVACFAEPRSAADSTPPPASSPDNHA